MIKIASPRWLVLSTAIVACAPDLHVGQGGGGADPGGAAPVGGDGPTGAGATGGGEGGAGAAAPGGSGGNGAGAGGAEVGGAGGAGGAGGGANPPVCGNGVVESGEACDDGNASDGDACTTQCEAQEVLAISTGMSHACAILTGGGVKCWGKNDYGQLGVGDFDNRGDGPNEMGAALPFVDLDGVPAVEISAGVLHTCALLADNTVRCWGNATIGELGTGDVVIRNTPGPAVPLGSGLTVEHITAGSGHTCALFSDKTAKCWGFGIYGQLGNGGSVSLGDEPGEMGDALPFVDLSEPIAELQAGNFHTCARTQSGGVRCWGYNSKGELGLGDTAVRTTPPATDLPLGAAAVALGAGAETSCALFTSGDFKCWGWGAQAALGSGSLADVGDQPGELAALPPVSLGGSPSAWAIGIQGGCANVINQGVKCWGENAAGVSGQGVQTDWGDDPNEMGANLPTLDLGSNLSVLSLPRRAFAYQCALLDDHSVKCWGFNASGQLGLGDVESRGDNPNEMGNFLPRVRLFNDAW